MNAQRCRVLILAVLIGFTAMTLHTSMHAQPDPQSCKVCGGHFDASHAVPLAVTTPIVAESTEILAWLRPQSHHSEPRLSYRQRAPPILS